MNLGALASPQWFIDPSALNELVKRESPDATVLTKMKEAAPRASSFEAAVERAAKDLVVENRVALVRVCGAIWPEPNIWTWWLGDADCETVQAQLVAAAQGRADRVLLVLDTPGGLVTGVQELAAAIRNSPIPVDAYVKGSALSAGYWLASACRTIYAAETARVGCLGVAFTLMKDPEYLIDVVSEQTPNKLWDASNPESIARVRAVAGQIADVFLREVAEGRGLASIDEVVERFDGGATKAAAEALSLGMVDHLVVGLPLEPPPAGQESTMKTKTSARAGAATPVRAAANDSKGTKPRAMDETTDDGGDGNDEVEALKEQLAGALKKIGELEQQLADQEDGGAAGGGEQDGEMSARLRVVEDKLRAAEKALEDEREQRLADQAAAYADELVRDHKIEATAEARAAAREAFLFDATGVSKTFKARFDALEPGAATGGGRREPKSAGGGQGGGDYTPDDVRAEVKARMKESGKSFAMEYRALIRERARAQAN